MTIDEFANEVAAFVSATKRMQLERPTEFITVDRPIGSWVRELLAYKDYVILEEACRRIGIPTD